MGEGLLQVLLLVFFKGRIRRERIDGEVAVGERFMNNDGYGENCPDVRLKKILLTSESGWGGGEIRGWIGERSLQAVMKPVVVGRSTGGSLLLATVKGSGAEKGRERKKEDSGYKKSFMGQRDDSAFATLCVHVSAALRGNRSAWLPRVFTYPALIMRHKISNRTLEQAYIYIDPRYLGTTTLDEECAAETT